jgi:hypothetical protein
MRVIDVLQKKLSPMPNSVEKSWDRGTVKSGRTHPVQALLGKHLDPKTWDDPRAQMAISRVLIWCLPFLRKALVLHAAFLGNIKIVADDDTLKETLEQFVKSMPIIFQDNPEWRQHFFGLNNFCKMLLATALSDGLAFSEEVYDDQNGPMAGMMVLPSDKFDFKPQSFKGANAIEGTPANVKKVLIYTAYTGRTMEIRPSQHFYVFGTRFRPGAMWGLQMVDGGQFLGEFLIRILVSRMKLHSRFGNPPSIDTFILKDAEKLQEADIERFINEASSVHEDIVSSQTASEQGKSAAIVARMVGNVEHKHEMYGSEATASTDFTQEYETLAKQLALVTDMPPEFLGFDTAGGGLGDAKFNVLNGITGSVTEDHRELLSPVIRRILTNYLISIGAPNAWLESFDIGWDELDTNDAKLLAETDLKEAEAFAKHLDNIMTLVANGLASEDKIREYADRFMLDIDLPDPKEPPVPEPVPVPDPNPQG